jgi:hypothetical protein
VPRFVVLEHTGTPKYKPGVHWDLMLEVGESLKTWELDSVPTNAEPAFAKPLPEHRLDYLQYEGPISGERGAVRRVDCGTYETLCENQAELVVRLEGKILQGRLHLRSAGADSGGTWRITFDPS